MTAATDTRQAPAAATASQTNSTSATGVPAEPRLQPGWAPTGAQPPRAGSRRAAVISLLVKSGWEPEQVDRDYQLRPPTDPPSVSRLHHHGSREDRVAYVLNSRPHVPTAVLVTVGAQHDPVVGLQRAIRQATKLDVPLAYSTNGHATVEHFMASSQTRPVSKLAPPVRAWRSYLRLHRLKRVGAQMIAQDFDHSILSDAVPPLQLRYYQTIAVNRALAAASRDQRRVLLLLAAGSGTTVTATALIAKFAAYKAHTERGEPAGIVYLDDRPGATEAPTLLAPLRRVAHSLGARVAVGSLGDSFDGIEPAKVDLLVVNLAHGGQVADPSTWQKVAGEFPNALQVGIVGVPSTVAPTVYDYFGRPVYRYGAEQARADGYLKAVPASTPDPADQGPEEIDLAAALASGPKADKANDRLALAVRIRREVEYANLAAGQQALATKLVSLLHQASQGGPGARAAARLADQLASLEILAELEDQVGGEPAVRRHIALLRELLQA